MPLNEAGPRRSNLKPAERREALAAIYGIPPAPSDSELEELRELLTDNPTGETL